MKAILFDAGNTLIWLDHPFLVETLRAHGVETTGDALLAAEYVAKRRMDEILRSSNPGTDASRLRSYFAEIFREVGAPEEIFPALAQSVAARHAERNLWCRLQPGTAEALQALRGRGYLLGVISNSDGRIEALLESVGLAGYFEFVLDSAVAGVEKPDPRIFRMALDRLGLEPAEALYVGDIYVIDVEGARAAGMRAVLIDPLDRWGELDCDRIAGVHELPEWLERAG